LAITPDSHSGLLVQGRGTTSFVTPDDAASESDAMFDAEEIIRAL
jgi:hypothetical protein